jgi:protein-S-isoprenylcysteine O-methyltransferase Ste14
MANLGASVALVALACGLHRVAPWHAGQFAPLYGSEDFSFTGAQFLLAAALGYSGLLALFFLFERAPTVSKSLRFFRVLARCVRDPRQCLAQGLAPADRVAVLSTLLKAFFGPLMAMWLMMFCVAAIGNGSAIVRGDLWQAGALAVFDRHGFWLLMQLILFVDVFVFTIGYLVEMPRLGNSIRSVDPTLLGWAAALMCYPPFNIVTSKVMGSQVSDFPRFDDPMAHVALNGLLLTLMAVYSWASVALGFKASNLTHRGIVARGPYAFVRHPAYVCKNMAWWIGSVPLVSLAFSRSAWDGAVAVGSVVGWTALYALRAMTEEDHLRSVDAEYAAYAARVRYRFIPGLY